MLHIKNLRSLLSVDKLVNNQIAGLKSFKPPVPKGTIEYPERLKLKLVEKVPQYPPSVKPFKMQRRQRYIRGPEMVQTELIHRQFGIVATVGGYMKFQHFEMVRHVFLRRFRKIKNIFTLWRIDSPWQPISRKSQGVKKGGGKGAIDHYATPVKSGRVILEVGGDIEYYQVSDVMKNVANKLPFPAKAVTYEQLLAEHEFERKLEEDNVHPYTWKYIIQNNLGGCHRWVSPTDKLHFNKYQ